MDLFDYMKEQNLEQEAPLASRIRPSTLEEVVGRSISSERISCFTEPSRLIN